MSDTNILLAGALLAVGLLWPVQGHAYCSSLSGLLSNSALCEMEERLQSQRFELEMLNARVKEMEAIQRDAEVRRSIAEHQRQSDEALRDLLGQRR